MEKKNIEYIMNMTKSYLDGKINSISYSLDFPYEIEKRYNLKGENLYEFAIK